MRKITRIIFVISICFATTLMAKESISLVKNISADDEYKLNEILAQIADYYDGGRDADARRLVDGAFEDHPNEVTLFVFSAALYVRSSEWQKALLHAQKARDAMDAAFNNLERLRLNPKEQLGRLYETVWHQYFLVVRTIAVSNLGLGELRLAKKDFLLVAKKWPDLISKSDLAILADLCQMSEDYVNATIYYKASREKAIKDQAKKDQVDKDSDRNVFIERSAYNLVIAYDKLGDTVESENWLSQLLKETKNQKHWLDKMGKDEDYVRILKRKSVQEILEKDTVPSLCPEVKAGGLM